MTDTKKEKIAILGGGWGAISTALYLTDPNNPSRDRYDITVYQMGWRLGGKGASGRGPNGRIEEHGLHIWIGFYNNSFSAIQKIYEEVQPIYKRITNYEKNPFKSWTDAFKPHSYIVLAEKIDAQWKTWPIDFPTNDEVPGQGNNVWLSPWDYLEMLAQFLFHHHRQSALSSQTLAPEQEQKIKLTALQRLQAFGASLAADGKNAGETAVHTLLHLVKNSDADNRQQHGFIADAANEVLDWLRGITGDIASLDDDIRRVAIVLELVAVSIIGLVEDDVLRKGLDSLDVYDLREWFRRHGAREFAVLSAPVQALYDLVFGYENGEIAKPNFAAGAAIRSAVRIGLTYKGAIFWKMQAGMGDVVFAPPYLVLKERGVKFRYFHKVEQLHLNAAGDAIDSIDLQVQATLKPGVEEYQPLVNVKDLPSWPALPDYDQLVQGAELKRRNINLESFYTDWKGPESLTLKQGEDFDRVVLGISVGALPYLCAELMQANPRFKDMVEKVGSVRTQAMQLWLKEDLEGLGWTGGSPVMDAYEEPLNTWSDMSQLIEKETWPEGSVKNIAYFCGPMVGGIPPAAKTDEPLIGVTGTQQAGLNMLQAGVGFLWPKAAPKDNPSGLDFSYLTPTEGDAGTAMERFDQQYFRANIDPSERYVLSLAGSTEYRLRADESGFNNLVLAGDWTRNGFNAGCVEATTMSGMQAANAISGFPPLEGIDGLEGKIEKG